MTSSATCVAKRTRGEKGVKELDIYIKLTWLVRNVEKWPHRECCVGHVPTPEKSTNVFFEQII